MPGRLIESDEIIIGSIKNLKRRFASYAEFAAWYAALAVVYWAFTEVLRTAVPDKSIRFALSFAFSVPLSITYIVLWIAVIDFTARAIQRKRPDVRDSLLHGAHALLHTAWVVVLTVLAVALAVALPLAPTILFVTLSDSVGADVAVSFLGITLAIVAGILCYVWFRFSVYHAVVDGVYGRNALAASRRLISKRWWPVFIRVVIPGIFFYLATKFALAIVYLLVGSVLGDPGLFFGPVPDPDLLPRFHSFFITIVPQAAYGFFLPLFLAADTLLWTDLKRTPIPRQGA